MYSSNHYESKRIKANLKLKSLPVFLALLALAGVEQTACGLRTPPVANQNASPDRNSTPGLGEEFTLSAGEEAVIKGEGLKVQFESLVEDGRCPPEVKCVWQGNAKIRIRLLKAGEGEGLIELNTAEGADPRKYPATGTYLKYKVRLAWLSSRPVKAHLLVTTNGP